MPESSVRSRNPPAKEKDVMAKRAKRTYCKLNRSKKLTFHAEGVFIFQAEEEERQSLHGEKGGGGGAECGETESKTPPKGKPQPSLGMPFPSSQKGTLVPETQGKKIRETTTDNQIREKTKNLV